MRRVIETMNTVEFLYGLAAGMVVMLLCALIATRTVLA